MIFKVNEIFCSLQGESVHAGLVCTFVRLTGCNLRCRYCDTRYAFYEGDTMRLGQIVDRLRSFGCRLVEITGGEPLAQEATPVLIETLLDDGFTVLLETNGSLDIDRADRRCSRIMDIKCPSSGESQSSDPSNLGRLTAIDQVKYVIGDYDDFLFAVEHLSSLPDHLPAERVLFSAVSGRLPPAKLAQWMVDGRVKARFQPQLHKILWPDRERGV